LLVQLDRVAQQPHQVVARVELRAEARRMPRGATRQLRLLEEDDVVPAEFRQVIREAAAGDSASDDRDPGLLDGGQGASPYRRAVDRMIDGNGELHEIELAQGLSVGLRNE